jgi:hypothetical protein
MLTSFGKNLTPLLCVPHHSISPVRLRQSLRFPCRTTCPGEVLHVSGEQGLKAPEQRACGLCFGESHRVCCSWCSPMAFERDSVGRHPRRGGCYRSYRLQNLPCAKVWTHDGEASEPSLLGSDDCLGTELAAVARNNSKMLDGKIDFRNHHVPRYRGTNAR